MKPKITQCHRDYGINARKIVERIIRYAPEGSLKGLEEIHLADKDPSDIGFSNYIRRERKIQLFIEDILGWQPWLLRVTYILPYITIGIALGHEIDHHVNRNKDNINREFSAERNSFKYIYPSLGIFKTLAVFFLFMAKIHSKLTIRKAVENNNSGRIKGIINQYTKSLEINPNDSEMLYNRGVAWNLVGDYSKAIDEYEKTLEINPNDYDAINNLAWLLATCPDQRYRNGKKALELAQKLPKQRHNVHNLDTLAAAFAEVGNFENAVKTQKKLISLIDKSIDNETLVEFEERLKSYLSEKPWREQGR